MNKLALGTVQFGLNYGIANKTGRVLPDIAGAMLRLAASCGVDTLDTAVGYGESEICLGQVGVQGFKVVTKLPAVPDDCLNLKSWVSQQLTASCERLGVSRLYGLLLHRPDQLLGPQGNDLYSALLGEKKKGTMQKIGISVYTPVELERITKYFPFDLLQAPFNLIDRRFYTTGWLQRLHQEGVEIHVRSVFLQGLLLMPQNEIPAKFKRWDNLWNTWHHWLESHNESAVQACLTYPLSIPQIDRVVVGVDNVPQLQQILSAARSPSASDLPDLLCDDTHLIIPSFWKSL